RLVEGRDGLLYGVTRQGGITDGGTFFRIQKGGTGFTVLHSFEAGAPPPGDYDGDGKVDFAACRNADGQWYVLKSGFTYTTAFGVPWGTAIDLPRSADYDGDGIADMASYDSTTGEWDVRLSSSDFTLTLERTLGGPGYVLPR